LARKVFAPLLERKIEDRRVYEEFDFSQVAEVQPVKKVTEDDIAILWVEMIVVRALFSDCHFSVMGLTGAGKSTVSELLRLLRSVLNLGANYSSSKQPRRVTMTLGLSGTTWGR
jgi:hypothetical protein